MKTKICLISVLCAVIMSGCVGSDVAGVALTDEETAKIANYAAEKTVKYSGNYDDRIMSDEEIAYRTQKRQEREEKLAGIISESTPENADATDAADDTNSTDTTDATSPEGSETADAMEISVDKEDIAIALGLENCSVKYTGFDKMETYPNEETGNTGGTAIVVQAEEASELLLLKFELQNTSTEKQRYDILDTDTKISATLNNEKTSDVMTTLLLNDLSTLYVELDAGEKMDTVAIVEVPKDYGEINSISLSIMGAKENYTASLE